MVMIKQRNNGYNKDITSETKVKNTPEITRFIGLTPLNVRATNKNKFHPNSVDDDHALGHHHHI
eukprot:UN10048